MKNKYNFQHFMSTSMLLVFALSLNALNVQAKENGTYQGPDFIGPIRHISTIRNQANPRELALAGAARKIVKVKGYAVNASTAVFDLNVSDEEGYVIPLPIVSTSTTTSTAFTISNIQVSVLDSATAVISWTSSILADSQVEYGTTTSYLHTVGDPALVLSHTITLPGLTADTLYHYRVSSKDSMTSTANQITSDDATFLTVGSAICAGPGLRADVYGGPNHVCCAGLVLQGGLCNNPPSTATTTPSITVTSPNGGESWEAGSTHTITWNSTGILSNFDGIILLDVYKGDQNQVVATADVPHNPGSYTLTLQNTIPESDQYKVRLTSCTKNYSSIGGYQCLGSQYFAMDTSDNTFKITAASESSGKVSVCHYTAGKGFQEITTDENGWLNGHKNHTHDYLKPEGKACDEVTILETPTLPISKPVTKPITPIDARDGLIAQLRARIQKLELQLSEVEKRVTEQAISSQTTVNTTLVKRLLKGNNLLIAPESQGNVWYLDPVTQQRYFLQNGESAYNALRVFGLGISETTFEKFQSNSTLAKAYAGRILLRVESHGEAYYVDKDGNLNYLQNGESAYGLMKNESLGISNKDLNQITPGSLGQ